MRKRTSAASAPTTVRLSPAELTALDGQWAAIKAGEPTVLHDDVARWLDTWGTPGFRPLTLPIRQP